MNWNNVSLVVLGLSAFFGAFVVALWISLVIWTFRDMRARSRDAFAQLLAALMVLVLGPFGVVLYLMLRPRETLAEKYERSLEEEALLQDVEERSICPGCKQSIELDYMVCPICHTRLRHPCVHCDRLIHPRWSICPYCAQSQKPVPGAEQAGRVTLLDLAEEDVSFIADVEMPEIQGEVEPVAALEAEAMRNLSKSRYDATLGTGWEQDVADVEGSQDEEQMLSASDEFSDDEIEDSLDAEMLAQETEQVFPVSDNLSNDETEDSLDEETPAQEAVQDETDTTNEASSRRTLSLFKRR
jgi:RNA polymerase subunit RPABC4/transcription elongation factor Spt4